MDFTMPFMIQTFRQYEDRIKDLERRNFLKEETDKEKQQNEEKQNEREMQRNADLFGPNQVLAISNVPYYAANGGMMMTGVPLPSHPMPSGMIGGQIPMPGQMMGVPPMVDPAMYEQQSAYIG